jgi:predicted GH43/DUF377 family glycosyl hydrolase
MSLPLQGHDVVHRESAAEPRDIGDEVPVRRLPIRLVSDDRKVIMLPFMTANVPRVRALFDRLDRLADEQVRSTLEQVSHGYRERHRDITAVFLEHYQQGASLIRWKADWSDERRRLAGAYLTMEYAIESAALFNPSIVPHPDQSGVEDGALRIVLSLRATGEGHVSSAVFRTGLITADGSLSLNPPPRALRRARISPDRRYLKPLFRRKLAEMGIEGSTVDAVLAETPEEFTLDQLRSAITKARPAYKAFAGASSVIRTILWLARSNYHIDLPAEAAISELVIYPLSVEESRGIEDLRLVRFVEEDGGVIYYGTYTAYDGERIMPMLISTRDFHRITVHSLNGACAVNKGMALFPRRVDGHYCMCSRVDGENLYIMYSDYVHFWESAERLAVPVHPWELMHIGNCGSPVETAEGWLLLTHGVGPMRGYCIGAMLLDREDPLKVLGHLDKPLISPVGEEREGYVPNVVYTCGALIHHDQLFVPYALADKSTSVAVIDSRRP